MAASRTLRFLIAGPGVDGRDRGAKVIARALADAGHEVIYAGLHQTPEMIAAAAVQEAVDAIGLSLVKGGQLTLCPAVLAALAARGVGDTIVFGLPEDDEPALPAVGVTKMFAPGTSTNEIIAWVEAFLRPKVA